jgi:hypothetical protein
MSENRLEDLLWKLMKLTVWPPDEAFLQQFRRTSRYRAALHEIASWDESMDGPIAEQAARVAIGLARDALALPPSEEAR